MIDTSLSTFERDVLDASADVPVLVAFWAPWCVPSRALNPLLERLEREYGGRFRLVNVNSDTNPELVSSFQLTALPVAVAFVAGNAVAQFEDAQSEVYVRAFLDRLAPNPADIEHRDARDAMVRGEVALAEQCLRGALALDPSSDAARLDMVSLLLARDDFGAARAHYALLSAAARDVSTYAAVRARMEAAEAATCLPSRDVLERRAAANADDLQARLDLADLHVAAGDYAAGMDRLLEIVARDRAFGEDVGRIRMLEVLEMAASRPALVDEYRRRLSQVLF